MAWCLSKTKGSKSLNKRKALNHCLESIEVVGLLWWLVENVERTHKDKFSWSRCSIWHVLQCNSSVRLLLYTNTVKIFILRYKLNSVNTPMQKTNNATCWVIKMDFSWCKKKANKIFVTRLGLQKLIINEKDVSVETFKKTEYTPSKLHENKQIT